MSETYVFTGGYTIPTLMGSGEVVPPRCEGILTFAWDEGRGTLEKRCTQKTAVNPSWVQPDQSGGYLYAVSELKEYHEIEGSTVSAYRIDSGTGELTFLNKQATAGTDACHLLLAPNGKCLVCSNYSDGSVSVFPIREDHTLSPMSCLIRHHGRGTDPARQEGPHAHQAILSPDGTHVYVSDLGLDTLVCYDADWENGLLTKSSLPDISCRPGQGCRHALFAPDGKHLYQIAELTCEVNTYTYDEKSGKANLVQTLSAMEDGVSPEGSLGAAIHLHPSGKWLYVSVRGTFNDHDRLVMYAVKDDGTLERRQILHAGGKIPRDFSLTPEGTYLLCGTQESDTITVFAVDPVNGTLQEHSRNVQAGGVTRVAFWKTC